MYPISDDDLLYPISDDEFEPLRIPSIIPQFKPTYSPHNSQMIQDYEPTFLPYRNRNIDEQKKYQNIWNEIHFHLYAIYFLEQVDHKLTTSDSFIEKACRYFLKKMKIVITMQLINQIENQQNILSINLQEWLEFIESSESLHQIIQNLKQYTLVSKDIFEIEAYQQFNEDFDYQTLDFQDKQLYIKIKQSITPDIPEKTFQDAKVPFRLALKECYKALSNSFELTANMHEYARLQFMMICCMCINQVFGPTRNQSMKKILEYHHVSNINTPTLIEIFLEKATIENLQKQAQMIEKFYF